MNHLLLAASFLLLQAINSHLVTGGSTKMCPDGWTESGVSCYIYTAAATTSWATAESSCMALDADAHLASMIGGVEGDAVRTVANGASAWIGVNDLGLEQGTQGSVLWGYTDERAVITWSNWASRYPEADTADEDCGWIDGTTGQWKTAECTAAAATTEGIAGYVCRLATINTCLYGEDEVETEVGTKLVKDLTNGDRVLSLSEQGSFIYDEVFMVVHAAPETRTTFLRLDLEDGSYIHVTSQHYVVTDAGEKTAGQLRPGDRLYSSANLSLIELRSVTALPLTGLYNPLTRGGRMFVRGVLASAYTSHLDGALSGTKTQHAALWLARQIHAFSPRLTSFEMNRDGVPFFWPALSKVVKAVM